MFPRHFIIPWGSFRGQREEKWGSFRGRDHFGVDLEIISGLDHFGGGTELEKAVETFAYRWCSHKISRSPKLPLVFLLKL